MSRRGRSSKRLRSGAGAASLADLLEVAVITPGAELEVTLGAEYSDTGKAEGPTFSAEVDKEGWLTHRFETYPDVATFLAQMQRSRRQEMKRMGLPFARPKQAASEEARDGTPAGWECARVDGERLAVLLANFRCIRSLSPSKKQRRMKEQERAKEQDAQRRARRRSAAVARHAKQQEEQEEEQGQEEEGSEEMVQEAGHEEEEEACDMDMEGASESSDEEAFDAMSLEENNAGVDDSLGPLSPEEDGISSSPCISFPPQSLVSTLSSRKSEGIMEALAKQRRAVRAQQPVNEYMLLSMDESDQSNEAVGTTERRAVLSCASGSESDGSPLPEAMLVESEDEFLSLDETVHGAPPTEELLSMNTGSLQRGASELGSAHKRTMHRRSLLASQEEGATVKKVSVLKKTKKKELPRSPGKGKGRSLADQKERKKKAMHMKQERLQRKLDSFFRAGEAEKLGEEEPSQSPALIQSLTDDGDELAMPTLAPPMMNEDSLPALPSLDEEEEEDENLPPTQPAPAAPAQPLSWRTAAKRKSSVDGPATPTPPPASPSSAAPAGERDGAVDGLVIVGSGLPPQMANKLKLLTKKLGGTFSSRFTPAITHLVVHCDAKGAPRTTVKLHQAILAAAKVLSYDWVLDSFQKLKWADERRFLVKSLPGIARSQQAKRLGKPPLFSGKQFCLWGDYEAPSKEEIASIVETGGGKVLPQLPPVAKTFQEEEERERSVVVLCHPDMTEEEAEQVFFQCGIQPLAVHYVLDCACHYELLGKGPYKFQADDDGTAEVGMSLAY